VTLPTKPHLVNNNVGVGDGLDGIGVLRDFNISAKARAAAPLDAELLFKLDCSIIIGDFTRSLCIRRCKSDTIVNVKNSVGTAWRPDHGLILDSVLLGVGLAIHIVRSRETGSCHGSLLSSLGEIVGGDEIGDNTRIKPDIAVVCGCHDRHLVSSWVPQIQVKLAILLLIRWVGTGSNSRLEGIETKSNYRLVWRQQSAYRTSGAAIARVTCLLNSDLSGNICTRGWNDWDVRTGNWSNIRIWRWKRWRWWCGWIIGIWRRNIGV